MIQKSIFIRTANITLNIAYWVKNEEEKFMQRLDRIKTICKTLQIVYSWNHDKFKLLSHSPEQRGTATYQLFPECFSCYSCYKRKSKSQMASIPLCYNTPSLQAAMTSSRNNLNFFLENWTRKFSKF